MRKLLLGVFIALLIPMAALAQTEYPKAEIFGGYSYLRVNPEGFNLNGWNASVAANVTSWFGVEGDFSGHYGSPGIFGFQIPYVNINSYTFMGGPKLTYRTDKFEPFAHFLIGADRASTGALGYNISDTALAAVVGGGIDINVSKSLAVRAIQVDYLMTRFNAAPQIFFSGLGDHQNNFRFSAGLVLKLGR
ncbi:MAG TPA: outer membrane beta-barrel protein [Acidobacteriota bacterium]|nr:outer membrane beta-barrel protein [Acidobacteriota bacterium]